jgi:hypothetical protein
VVRTARETRTLLANPDLQIPRARHDLRPGPAARRCKRSNDESSQHRTPDLDDCRPTCVNIAPHRPRHSVNREQVAQLRQVLEDPLAPPIRRTRERHELARLERILTDHETTWDTTS